MDNNTTPVIISLGGSIVIPDDIDVSFLKQFKTFIEEQIGVGRRFVLIVGGGKTCRKYQAALKELREVERLDLDWLGIYSTRFNAEFVKSVFKGLAHPEIFFDLDKEINWNTPLLIGAGWKPGCSTDMDAVLVAEKLGAKKVINLTNIERVFDKDPKQHSDAEPKDELSWDAYRNIIPKEWVSGMNTPFDPMASEKAQALGLEVAIIKGQNIEALKNYIEEKPFDGTRLY